MGNYKQEKVTGWQRSKQVIIKNDYKVVPTIEFTEEMVVEVDGALINKKDVGTVGTSLKDPSMSFDLLNPENDQIIGKGNYGQAYVLLYSIYRHLADKRDIRDLKWPILVKAKEEYEKAVKLAAEATAAYAKAKTSFDKDPSSGTLSNALSVALNEKTSADNIAQDKKFIMDSAQEAFDTASDYL
jgi:hypothetical protein